jgi:hypothetical protein
MAECLACKGVPGTTHTCPGSGTFLAAEAHDSGEIEAAAGAWPNWQATIHLHLRAPDEQVARQHLTGLMGVLLDDALVAELDFALELAEIEVPS